MRAKVGVGLIGLVITATAFGDNSVTDRITNANPIIDDEELIQGDWVLGDNKADAENDGYRYTFNRGIWTRSHEGDEWKGKYIFQFNRKPQAIIIKMRATGEKRLPRLCELNENILRLCFYPAGDKDHLHPSGFDTGDGKVIWTFHRAKKSGR